MVVTHVKFFRVNEDHTWVEYIVKSFDFNDSRNWEQIGQVLINKQDKTYEFKPSKIWTDCKMVPPSVFCVEKTERDNLLKTTYKGFNWGIGVARIHHWATSFIDEGSFPPYFPPSFFLS